MSYTITATVAGVDSTVGTRSEKPAAIKAADAYAAENPTALVVVTSKSGKVVHETAADEQPTPEPIEEQNVAVTGVDAIVADRKNGLTMLELQQKYGLSAAEVRELIGDVKPEKRAASKSGTRKNGEPRKPRIVVPDAPKGKKACRWPDHEGDRVLPVDQFGKHSKKADGLYPYCRECQKARSAARRDVVKANRENAATPAPKPAPTKATKAQPTKPEKATAPKSEKKHQSKRDVKKANRNARKTAAAKAA